MNISLNWLKDFVPITLPAKDYADILTGLGLEIAKIKHFSIPKGIVAALVLSVEKHPSADKLHVCSVSLGSGDSVQIVCGAPNVAAGLTVPCATIGTVMSPELTITKAKLRGVESFGMLCSERELTLSDDHSGLMILSGSIAPGTPLNQIYPNDSILELEITPNRGDCLSLLGVARELAAKLGVPLSFADIKVTQDPTMLCSPITVQLDAQACPRYMGRFIANVSIGPSPEWLKNRLSILGLRSINNVVDVTNYILFNFGHPMHAFDAQTIAGNHIAIKNADSVATFTTLDGIERKLVPEDLLIWDAEKPIALAGIMGGLNSSITQSTKNIFLECAYFDPVTVRKTSKRLGLSSDSSYRFERGVDPLEGLSRALDTAAELIRLTASGTIATDYIDCYPSALPVKSIALRTDYVNRLLGIVLSDTVVHTLISSLVGFTIQKDSIGHFTVIAPHYRHDITIEADLVEEIGRLYGYDTIPASEHGYLALAQPENKQEKKLDALKKALCGAGLAEIVCNSLVSVRTNQIITPDIKAVELLNPLNPDMAQLRTSLTPSMLSTIAYNLHRRNKNNRFFEIGRIFSATSDPIPAAERSILCIGLEGDATPASWAQERQPLTFHHAKGLLTSIGITADSGPFTFSNGNQKHGWYNSHAVVSGPCGITGHCGLVGTELVQFFDIKSPVYLIHLDITQWLKEQPAQKIFKGLDRYPSVERDFCFVIDQALPASTIADHIATLSPLICQVTPFDVYAGEKLGAGKKSIAYSVTLQSPVQTLTAKETEPLCDTIIQSLSKNFGATLRT